MDSMHKGAFTITSQNSTVKLLGRGRGCKKILQQDGESKEILPSVDNSSYDQQFSSFQSLNLNSRDNLGNHGDAYDNFDKGKKKDDYWDDSDDDSAYIPKIMDHTQNPTVKCLGRGRGFGKNLQPNSDTQPILTVGKNCSTNQWTSSFSQQQNSNNPEDHGDTYYNFWDIGANSNQRNTVDNSWNYRNNDSNLRTFNDDDVLHGGGIRDSKGCKEIARRARDCPNSSNERKKSGCYKCNEIGHMARDCPNTADEGKKSGCYKCNEIGHMARDCPNSTDGGKKSGCFKCNEIGHMATDCPNVADEGKKSDKPLVEKYIPPPEPNDETSLFESVPQGINFLKYDNIPVQLFDNESNKVPLHKYEITSFESSNLHSLLLNNISKSKYNKPTPVQKHAIPIISGKHDLMACAQTGSGKTAAFLLPVMNYMLESNHSLETCNPTVLIIVPTRELALQTRKEAQKFSYNTGIRAVEIYGGVTSLHQVSQIKNGCNILIATPGRLLDFLRRKTVSIKLVEFLILDEADRMLDMSFGKDIAEIIQKFGLPSKEYRHSLMFSATFPREVQELAKDFLNDYFFLAVGQIGSANQDVSQNFYKVPKFDKRNKLVEILSESKLDRTIVFVEQKRIADFIASYLCQNDFPTTSIHGDRFQRERELALTDFRNGSCSILVATAVAARGLDIKDVKHVINYDLPKSIDEYVHRIGRTGRVGNLGKATSFYDRDVDLDLASSLVKILEDADQKIPEWLKSDGESGGYSYGQNPYINRFGASDIRRSNNQFDGTTNEIKTSNIMDGTANAIKTFNTGDDEDWDS